MPGPSILQPLPPRPSAEQNTRWHRYIDGARVIVFVHGIFSNSRTCWTAETKNFADVFWPDLLARSKEFDSYSIYLAGFPTSAGSTDAGTTECADAIWDRLRHAEPPHPAPLSAQEIVFVCHSTGGILIRKLLVREKAAFAPKAVGLALIASPSRGSFWATVFGFVASFFGNDLAKALRLSNPELRDLHREFLQLREKEDIPRLFGREAYENRSPLSLFGWPVPGRIVPSSSAAVYFQHPRLLTGTNHFTAVKPATVDDPPHVFLRDFIADFQQFCGPAPAIPASSPWAISQFSWSVNIDHEGDAINQLSFQGLTSSLGERVFALPDAVVDFGHMTRFSLLPGHSGPALSLTHSEAAHNSRVKVAIEMATAPTNALPASFTIQNFDLNTYPLTLEEVRRRPAHPQDGSDFIEKQIDDSIGRLILQIRFPSSIVFAETPHIEIRKDNLPQPGHTAQLKSSFFFFPHLKTATLVVDNPPFPFGYRIAWRVGDSPPATASPPPPFALSRKLHLQRRLLKAQSEFFDPAAPLQRSNFAQVVDRSLIEFTALFWELIKQRLGRAPAFLPNTLDFSLMCPNQENTALVLVTGYNFHVPSPQTVTLEYGNGNAGRAWKQSATRVFVQSRANEDPKGNTYWEFPQQPRHIFLISVPLLDDKSNSTHAILNIGTTDGWHAQEILSALNDEMIETLTRYAQSNLLKALVVALDGPS